MVFDNREAVAKEAAANPKHEDTIAEWTPSFGRLEIPLRVTDSTKLRAMAEALQTLTDQIYRLSRSHDLPARYLASDLRRAVRVATYRMKSEVGLPTRLSD